MGHRHLYSTSQMFDGDLEQNWSPMQDHQHFAASGRNSTSENTSMFSSMEYMSLDGLPITSHWNPAPISNAYGSSNLTVDMPPYRPDPSGSTHDHFLHSSTAGAFCRFSENYPFDASSNQERQSFQVVEGSFVDLTMGSNRGPHKRKSPGIPPVSERGSTSSVCNAGSTLDLHTCSELNREKQSIDCQYLPWDESNINLHYRSDGLSIGSDSSLRNVRSRSAVDPESSLATTNLPSNRWHSSYSTSHGRDESDTVDLSSHGLSSETRDWSQMNISPGHGRLLFPESCSFSHETNHFVVGSSASNASLDMGASHHEFALRNSSLPQSYHGNSTQSVRGVRSNYSQRSNPASGASSSLRMRHVVPPDDGLHAMAESYAARHSRPLSSTGWRSSERNGRSRVANERYRSLAAAALHNRFSSEGFMIVNRTSLYGSRSAFDQHRNMRMDIDNMSYEELLALGERIGHVSTGLSEDLISKSLTEIIYCSSEQTQDEGSCAICLEEYKDRDDVGALKTCGHDYHVICIRKWLTMKNICPICKASVVDDVKGK